MVFKIPKILNERILEQLLPVVDFVWGVPLQKVRYHAAGHILGWKVYSETLHNLRDSEALMIETLADHAAVLSQIGLSDERPCHRLSCIRIIWLDISQLVWSILSALVTPSSDDRLPNANTIASKILLQRSAVGDTGLRRIR